MRNSRMNQFELLCKILESRISKRIGIDYGETYVYVRKKVYQYTNRERDRLLGLKAEAIENDYSKYFGMMIAQIALFLTIVQIVYPIALELISNINIQLLNDLGIKIEELKHSFGFFFIIVSLLMAVYWIRKFRKYEFTNKWRNYIIIVIDEIFKELEEEMKKEASIPEDKRVLVGGIRMGGYVVNETTKTKNRHEKALEYALNAIKNSVINPYVKDLYLYGSYARGTNTYSSDIDLFLVLDVKAKKLHSQIMELKSDVTDADDFCGVEVDLKVTFGDAWMRSNQLYHKNVKKDGIELWKKKELESYYDFAEHDYFFLKSTYGDGYVANCMASIAQGICEKYLKFVIEKEMDPLALQYEGIMKTHNISKLLKYIRRELPDFICDEEAVKMVEGYYSSTSYPGDESITINKKDLRDCMEAVETCRGAVIKYLEQGISDIKFRRKSRAR